MFRKEPRSACDTKSKTALFSINGAIRISESR